MPTKSSYLVHKIDLLRATVLGGKGIVPVLPDGGDGGMAALRHYATERPRVDQVSPEHHVLNNHVDILLLLAGAAADDADWLLNLAHR